MECNEVEMKKISWKSLANFFEHGDLVPLAVIISTYHYFYALQSAGDKWIAIPVALLIDMLHFRTVRLAVAVRSWVATGIAVATTFMAIGYHFLFYSIEVDTWYLVVLYALPMPLGIAILAWQQESQKEPYQIARWRKRAGIIIKTAKGFRNRVKALEIRLTEAEIGRKAQESKRQTLESKFTKLETRLIESENARKNAEAELSRMKAGYNKLNPLAQDVLEMVTVGKWTGQEVADRNAVSPGTVSKLKTRLNGGGGGK